MFPFGKPKQIKKQTVSSFNDLIDYLDKLDPIKLITQLTLTYLFYPGGEFKPEHDKIHKWSRWLEFICGYLLSRPYSDRGEEFVDGRNLNALEKLLEKYFMNIAKYVVTERKSNGTPEENHLLAHLKLTRLMFEVIPFLINCLICRNHYILSTQNSSKGNMGLLSMKLYNFIRQSELNMKNG